MSFKTPITIVQELSVQKGWPTPVYALIYDGTGSHEPLFKYTLTCQGLIATGSGSSKKQAKHDAAHNWLEIHNSDLPIESSEDFKTIPYEPAVKENAVGTLADFCAIHRIQQPVYELTRDEGLPHDKVFEFKCSVSSLSTNGSARTKKQAKHLSAVEMLTSLRRLLNIKDDEDESSDPFAPEPEYSSLISQIKIKDESTFSSNESKVNALLERQLASQPRDFDPSSFTTCFAKFADFHNALHWEEAPISATLIELCDSGADSISATNCVELLTKILDEMECPPIQFTQIPSIDPSTFVYCGVVRSNVTWTFCGFGRTEEEAKNELQMSALRHLVTLMKPIPVL